MTDTDEPSSFSYEVFDRQLNTYYIMCRVLINGWEDYSTQEMNFDIRYTPRHHDSATWQTKTLPCSTTT